RSWFEKSRQHLFYECRTSKHFKLVGDSIVIDNFFSPHLTEFLLQCPALLGEAKPRLATHYYNFLAQLWLPPGCTHSVPIPILREVQSLHPMFMGYGQHDAQEFLRVFLNRLHDELKVATGPGSCANPKGLKAESGDTGSTDSGFASSATSISCACDRSVQQGKTKQKKNRQKHDVCDKQRICHTCTRTVTANSTFLEFRK
ncbi:hypothetical protein FBUS_10647, partial [Fasciolopsis buskii]